MDSCLFCKIIAGTIPSAKVYEDDLTLAFRDINPKAPSHVLVIPKEHFVSVHDVPVDQGTVFTSLMNAVNQVVRLENLVEEGYRLVINSGENGGQLVPHIHVHVLGGRSLPSFP